MKKTYSPLLGLSIAFLLALSGCFGFNSSTPEDTTPSHQTEGQSDQLTENNQSDHEEERDQVSENPTKSQSEPDKDNKVKDQDPHEKNGQNEVDDEKSSEHKGDSSEEDQDNNDEPSQNNNQNGSDPSIPVIVSHMTLDEKIGQLVMVGVNGTQPGSHAKSLIRDYHVGGIILYGKNIETTNQTVKYLNQLKSINAKADNPLPLFLSVDQEGGRVERMPDAIKELPSQGKVGNTGDPGFARQFGNLIGTELSAFGFNMDFAPVLDVIRDPESSVIGDRSFGSDPQLVSKLGVAEMKGISSRNVIPVVKHFPGYGEVSTNAHTGLPVARIGLDKLQNVDWVPYKQVIANGADVVMVTHILLPKLDTDYPASMSKKVITGMLRDKLGFDGVVITDDMTMGAIKENYEIDQAAVRAVNGGADIVLVAFNYEQQVSVIHALKQAVKNGKISKKELNRSVGRILRLKREYGLSDQPAGNVNVNQLNQQIQTVLENQFS
ncbi:MAG TPA: beta-N-acetylhexosaminidase [Bacillales bacterium]|nr:beta-N-acetylhexosaminidase [Bacillales bacterium]